MKDPLPGSNLSVGEALLSPTRTYLPVVKRMIEELDRQVLGLVHCSGGGQTKCLRFGTRVHHVQRQPFPRPGPFQGNPAGLSNERGGNAPSLQHGAPSRSFLFARGRIQGHRTIPRIRRQRPGHWKNRRDSKGRRGQPSLHPAGWFDPSLRVSK